jgi:hypothetical protein
MTAVQAAIILVGALVLSTALMMVMTRINRSDRQQIERRRQAWVDAGRLPEDEPTFDGCGGDGG